MKKIINKLFELADVAIALYLMIALTYSSIAGIEISKVVDVDWWILFFILSISMQSYLSEYQEKKSEQE